MYSKKTMMAFGLLAIVTLILASCAPAATPTPKPAAPTAAPAAKPAAPTAAPAAKPAATPKPAAQQPRPGGILTSYITGNPPSLDTQQESTINTGMIVAPFYTNLVQADPLTNNKWVPGLAEKWEMSKDGLTWTFDIRQGVKFHDGTPFTTDDAVFNLKRITDPPKGIRSNMSFLLKPVVDSISKEGNKAKMTFKHPFAIVLDTLGHNYCAMFSEKYLDKNEDMKTSA
ncbi:MAG: ABC transporter substrate-binding protein, partial [Chloroflexota bacterium]